MLKVKFRRDTWTGPFLWDPCTKGDRRPERWACQEVHRQFNIVLYCPGSGGWALWDCGQLWPDPAYLTEEGSPHKTGQHRPLTVSQASPGSQRRPERGDYSSAYYLLNNICHSAFPSLNLDISLSLPNIKKHAESTASLIGSLPSAELSWIKNLVLSPPTLLAGPSPCRGRDRWSCTTITLRSDVQTQKMFFFLVKTTFRFFSGAQMTSEKNPNLTFFPIFSAITSTRKKKTTHQKSTVQNKKAEGKWNQKRNEIYTCRFYILEKWLLTKVREEDAAGMAVSLKFWRWYQMLECSKIFTLIIFYRPSEITVGYITRGFCRSKIEPEGEWEEKTSLLPPKHLPFISIHASAFPQSALSSTISPPPRISHDIGVWFLTVEEKLHCSTSSSTELCQWHLFWHSLHSFLISD